MADTPLTIAKARVTPLTQNERENGYNMKFKVRYSDIACGTGATDTVTLTLGQTPLNWIITRGIAVVTSSFVGTGTQTLAVTVGTTSPADADSILPSTSVLTAGVIQATTGPNTCAAPANCKGVATATIQAVFTNAAAGSPSALTAGEMDIYLNVLDATKLG